MRAFNAEAIRSLDAEHFSADERRRLLEMFFPALEEPDWKQQIQHWWQALKKAQFDARRLEFATGAAPWTGEGEVRYRVRMQDLFERARLKPLERFDPTVNSFKEWVRSLYLASRDPRKMADGQAAERVITRRFIRGPEHGDWVVDYDGTADSPAAALPIADLSIGGKPLWARPDYVLRHRESDEILLLEFKWSPSSRIPSDCWPDARAQVWAYSKIDRWKHAPRMTLVCEVWGWHTVGLSIAPRRIYRWNRDDREFAAGPSILFDHYKRHAVSVLARMGGESR